MKFSFSLSIVSIFLIVFTNSSVLSSQSSSADIYKDIKKFGVLANVLYVAAHPDDENTRMISYLNNHLSARTTYLSLTRGDGGQNLIGPEIREMLGIIRTHELLEARKIDGGFQMFTRANDFGYSKTAAETFKIWGRNEVLSDVVWAIRKVQPDVIINRFNTDTIRPNHGHHTASAILSVEAFDLAADASSYPEQLQYVSTWQPRRIFLNTTSWWYKSIEEWNKVDKSKMVVLDIGSYDEVSGESNSEIAGRSRSMHKSQGFGSAEIRGESLDYLDLIKDTEGFVPDQIFEGIDITWNRVPGGSRIAEKAILLETTFDFKDPARSVPLLLDIYKSILLLPDSFWKTIKLEECKKLIKDCLGLFVELRTSQFQSSPGTTIPATLEVINRSDVLVTLNKLIPPGDSIRNFSLPLANNKGFLKDVVLQTPDSISVPYWLKENPTEGLYNVSHQWLRGLAADPPSMTAVVELDIAGQLINFEAPVQYRIIDPAQGEIYKPIYITPPVTVNPESDVLVFSKGQERLISLTLAAVNDSIAGTLQIRIDEPGWTVTPQQIPWSFSNAGESVAVAFTISPPEHASSATLHPELVVGEQTFHHTVIPIDYDHLPYMSIVKDATVHLKSLDIKLIPRPIAYIEGAGDDVDEALSQLGFNVEMINPASISPALLNKYQVIILGVRAFNTVQELSYKNKILFDWVKAGGTLIVQYNTNRGLVTNDIAPFPLTLSRDRVTEESAPVTFIAPDHIAMNTPNKLTKDDFKNWVQERGLYFPSQWSEQFTPLFEMNDTGEAPSKGSLLIAPYGEGYYVYTGLSFFRHLPAGVPGSYRLLSNLISLGYKINKS